MIGAEDGWIYVTADRKKITKAFCHHAVFGSAAIVKAAGKGNPGSVTAMQAPQNGNLLVSGAKVSRLLPRA
jgi:hypothetical protein